MARDGARARGVGLGWLASVVLSLVMGVLLYVVTLEVRSGHAPVVPVAKPNVDCTTQQANLAEQIAQATAALEAIGLPLPTPIEETQGADRLRYVHRRYELSVPAQSAEDLKQRLRPLSERDPCVSVEVGTVDGGAQVKVGIDEVLTHTVVLHWIVPTPPRVRLAVVIEDLGADLLSAREFANIDAPLALAVVPARPFSKEVAELAHLFQREVLLDLRRDPTSDADGAAPPTPGAVVSEDVTFQLLDSALAAVPYVVGVKEPAEPTAPTAQVLGWLKLHQLFLIANAAVLDHDARQLAAALAIPLTSRLVVLDGVSDESAVRGQLDALVKLARERGAAIGVGHPHLGTASALRAALPQWRDAGLEVVPVSAIVHVPTLAAD